jgi:amino acid transporter
LVAVFIYWGWDSAVAVNEETEDASRTPGRAAVISTILLLAIYVVVSVAAIAFHGPDFLTENSDDVLGALASDVLPYGLDKLLIIAVLTSAAASTQTTILPQTRTMLSMSWKGALPKYFARIHPRFLTPSTATIFTGIFSVAWYVLLTIVSEDILFDSIAALGLMIAFYLGLTGLACTWYFRHFLRQDLKTLLLVGLVPFAGGAMMMALLGKSVFDLSDPANSESGSSWLGLGPPLVIAIIFLVVGIVLMFLQRAANPEFFRRKSEVATASPVDRPAQPAES